MRSVIHFFILLLGLFMLVAPTSAQTGGTVNATCPDGTEISNAAEVVVNMRSGFTYTATVLGINGFDPVLAVVTRGEVVECADNTDDAAEYIADLPTTGTIDSSENNAQLPFSHSFNSFENISLVIGGADGSNGEFLVILEGMAVTARDGSGPGAGDPFALRITDNMLESVINPSVYMLSTNEQLDPLLQLVDAGDNTEVIIECDDAGMTNCQDDTPELTTSRVSRSLGRETPPRAVNAMLTLPIAGADLDTSNGLYANFLMTSNQQATFGDYVVAFHVAVGVTEEVVEDDNDGGLGGLFNNNNNDDDNDNNPQQAQAETPTPPPAPTSTPAPPAQTGIPGGGVNLTCPNGQEITNGAEVVVNMRPGFTYTATAIGIDGFDPVLAVVNRGQVINCNDDSSDAATYDADLPSTGRITPSTLNSQLPFSHSFDDFEDISLVVGGFNGQVGEFLLIIEGMAVTAADGSGPGAGDPFSLRVTPNIVNADMDATVYMIGTAQAVDPLVNWINPDNEIVLSCDDAGNANLCAPGSSPLTASSISRSRGRTVTPDQFDSMLVLPTTQQTDLDFSEEWYFLLRMTSFQQGTTGEYLVAFHIEIAEENSGDDADL